MHPGLDEIVDSHIHLFDVANKDRPATHLPVKLFGWNDTVLRWAMKYLGPKSALSYFGSRTDMVHDYLVENFRRDSVSSKVRRYVHIQVGWKETEPMDPVGETRWLERLSDGPAAMVAFADLRLGAGVAPVLEAHKSASNRVRGIRQMLAWHPNKDVMNFSHEPEISRTPAFRAGYEQLAVHNLSFDAWCFDDQLDEVIELAAWCPEVPMVLCHAGTPVGIGGEFMGVGATEQQRDRIAKEWRDSILQLGQQQHVMCKLSGLLMPVLGFGYEHCSMRPTVSELVDSLGPLVSHCIEAFTPQRCIYASNFPVDRVSADYFTIVEALLDITAPHGAAAQKAMFADNAAAFYRI